MYMKQTNQGEQKRTLYIQTLGTMRLTSGDEIISLHTSITGKACQLFLLLAYAGTKGIQEQRCRMRCMTGRQQMQPMHCVLMPAG